LVGLPTNHIVPTRKRPSEDISGGLFSARGHEALGVQPPPKGTTNMFNLIDNAASVSGWTAYGIELPKALAEAINTFDKISATEIGHQPTVDLAKAAKNPEQEIRRIASELALVTPAPISHLQSAKNAIRQAAARSVLVAAQSAVPVIIQELTPSFEAAVS